jgi:hypothetical protein
MLYLELLLSFNPTLVRFKELTSKGV